MKKLIAMLLSLAMIFAITACGNSAAQTGQSSAENSSAVETQAEENNVSDDTQEDSSSAQKQSPVNTPQIQPAENNAPEEQNIKILVAYFSATNTTERIAEHIANGLNADLYEIVPEDPYTDADLDYNDNSSRSTIEMKDPSSRPAISGSVENMEQYDIVFIGYPIWWGEAPRIVSTFVESYVFSGKTIVPFCTSGGSGVGSSASNLEKLVSGATWLDGYRLNGSDSQDTVMAWVNSLGLDFGD